jgi:ubiquitin C-terminal hydrolase
MFGLDNFNGSCWVNAALQTIFRFPDVQARYNAGTFEKDNKIDECICRIWNSKGKDGLRELFEEIRTECMPAGAGMGDSHELLTYLCDKLPYLDKLCRFSIANSIECIACKAKTLSQDSTINFSLTEGNHQPISTCIQKTVESNIILDWTCEKCKSKGASSQQLIGSFPSYMIFHLPLDSNVNYSSILILNKRKYALSSVVCYNGMHWWTYGRDMPPGSAWFIFNDHQVVNHGPKQFPLSNTTRMLIYYCINE